MADVQIESSAYTVQYYSTRGGSFWTSPTVKYVVYIDSSNNLVYNKSSNGGTTWAGATTIRSGFVLTYDCWADWQTAGDSGTKIHIAYIDTNSDDIRYVYLDTATDSIGGDDQIEACQGTGNMSGSTSFLYNLVTITKARGGNIGVAFHYRDDASVHFYGFYTSPDASTWTSEAAVWESSSIDEVLLFPGNEADSQDLWAVFWDGTGAEISLKTYDDSGDSWSEQSISGGMAGNINYFQMDGQIRLSDGHLILAAWSAWDDAGADLMVWDINGAGSITAKTNIITDEAESFAVSVFINQVNDDIYVVYLSGTTATSRVDVFYQKSTDGGANWGGETAMAANGEDDMRWVSAGCIKASWGGKFQPVWFNDDLNDILCNTDNAITIVAYVPKAIMFKIPA